MHVSFHSALKSKKWHYFGGIQVIMPLLLLDYFSILEHRSSISYINSGSPQLSKSIRKNIFWEFLKLYTQWFIIYKTCFGFALGCKLLQSPTCAFWYSCIFPLTKELFFFSFPKSVNINLRFYLVKSSSQIVSGWPR